MGVDLDRFVNKPDDGLCCPVCLGAAFPAEVVCEAQHFLCSGCVDKLFEARDEHCPVCRRALSDPYVSQIVPRLLDKYQLALHKRRLWLRLGGLNQQRGGTSAAVPLPPDDLLRLCTLFRSCGTRTTRQNLPYHENYCTATRTRLADKEAEVQALNGSLHSAREAGVQAQTRIDGLEHALKEKDERLAHKEAEVRALNGSLHSAREAGVQVQARIDGLEHALEEKDKAVEHSDRQLKAKDREIQRLRRIIVADNDPPRPKPNTRTGGSDGNRLPEGQPAMDVEPHPSGSNKRWSRDPVPSVPAAPFSDPHGYSPNRRPQAKRSKLRAFADDE